MIKRGKFFPDHMGVATLGVITYICDQKRKSYYEYRNKQSKMEC